MKKGFISWGLVLAMLVSVLSLGLLSVGAETDANAYEYAATDLMVKANGSANQVVVSWRNATYSDIAKVELMTESGTVLKSSADTQEALSTASRTSNRYTANVTAETYTTFKLVTTTNSGKQITQYMAGKPDTSVLQGNWVDFGYSDAVTSGSGVTIIKSDVRPNYVEFEDGALKVVPNAAIWTGNMFIVSPKEIAQPNTKYTVSLKMKGALHNSGVKVYGYKNFTNKTGEFADLVNTGNQDVTEWTTRTGTFTTPSGDTAARGITVEFSRGDRGPIWVDEMVVSDESGNQLWKEDFESIAANDVTVDGLTATAKHESAVLNWNSTTELVRVYAQANGGERYLAGTFAPGSTGCEIGGLVNDTEYTFYAETITENGIPSEKSTVTVTPVYIEPVTYADEYAATDLMVKANGSANQVVVSWRNATYSDIAKVELMTESGTVLKSSADAQDAFSTKSHTSNRYTANVTAETYTTFKLVTTTNSGKQITQYMTGKPDTSVIQGNWIDFGYSNAIVSDSGVTVTKSDAKPNYVEFEDGALKVVPNALIWEGNVFIVSSKEIAQPNTKYTVSLKMKGALHNSGVKVYGFKNFTNKAGEFADLVNTGNQDVTEWTTKTGTFTTPSGDTAARGITVELQRGDRGPIWIDEMVVSDESGNQLWKEDFESIATNDVTVNGLTATAKSEKVFLKWNPTTELVRVYAQASGGERYLAGTFAPGSTGCEVGGLVNDTEYTFYAETITENGIPSAQTSVVATPVPNGYITSDVTLTDSEGSVVETNAIAAGNYKVSANIKNNKMGSEFTAEILFCLYDGNVLVDAVSSGRTVIAQTDSAAAPVKVTTAALTVPPTEGHNYKLKAYIWDSLGGMHPLEDTIEFFK